jgi:hypothetical protein
MRNRWGKLSTIGSGCKGRKTENYGKKRYSNSIDWYQNWKASIPEPSLFISLGIILRNSIFSATTPCSVLKASGRFGGRYHLHLQDRRIDPARNDQEEGSKICLAYSSETSIGFQWTT